MFVETDTSKWADYFCRMFRDIYVNINDSELKSWTHFWNHGNFYFAFYQKYPFGANLVRKMKLVSLS